MSYAQGRPTGQGGHRKGHMVEEEQREDVFQMLLGGGVRPVSPLPSIHPSSGGIHNGDPDDMMLGRHRTPSPPPFEDNTSHQIEDIRGYGSARAGGQQEQRYNQPYYGQHHATQTLPLDHTHGADVGIPENTPKARLIREFDNLVFEGLESGSHTPPPEPIAHTGVSIRAPTPPPPHNSGPRYNSYDPLRNHSKFDWANSLLGSATGDPEPPVSHAAEFVGSPEVGGNHYSSIGPIDRSPHWEVGPESGGMNGSHHVDSAQLLHNETLYKQESMESMDSYESEMKEENTMDPAIHSHIDDHVQPHTVAANEEPHIPAVEGPSQGGKATTNRKPKSPKSLAEREKNRQAVRNCRKRKRELEKELLEREKELKKEQDRLRLQVRLGTQELETEVSNRALELISKMEELLNAGKSGQAGLKDLVAHYEQLYKDINRNRNEAFKSIVTRLKRLNTPFPPSKMYLWQNKQDDAYFAVKGGMWSEMVATLRLTDKQIEALRKRRSRVASVCKEIEVSLQDVKKLEVILKKIQRKPFDSVNFAIISKYLSPEQTARLLVFVYGEDVRKHKWNPDGRWEKFLQSFDPIIQKERAMGTYKFTLPEDSPTTEEEQQAQLRYDRFKNAQIIKRFLQGPKQGLEAMAKKVFTDNVEMLDPNFKDSLKGRTAIVNHFSALRNAFSRINTTQKKCDMKRNKNVARFTWMLSGTYMGNKGSGGSRSGKPVTFPMTCAFNFEPGTAKVRSLVVSWAAFDLMQQLGILPPELLETRTKRSTLTPKQSQERCLAFCKSFEADLSKDRLKISKEYLDDECTVRDTNFGTVRGIQNFAVYLDRFRIIFPKVAFAEYKFHGKDSSKLPLRVHVGLLVQADYRGELVDGRSVSVEFPGELLFEFNPENDKIMEIVMTWQISAFLKQINVVR